MKIELKAPIFPDEINEASISQFYFKPGALVRRDELLFDIETDKVILEVVAPADGKVLEYTVQMNEHLSSNQIIGYFEECDLPSVNEEATDKVIPAGQESNEPVVHSEYVSNEKQVESTPDKVSSVDSNVDLKKVIAVSALVSVTIGMVIGALITLVALSK